MLTNCRKIFRVQIITQFWAAMPELTAFLAVSSLRITFLNGDQAEFWSYLCCLDNASACRSSSNVASWIRMVACNPFSMRRWQGLVSPEYTSFQPFLWVSTRPKARGQCLTGTMDTCNGVDGNENQSVGKIFIHWANWWSYESEAWKRVLGTIH